MLRVCSTCHTGQELSNFHKDSSSKDYYSKQCKTCVNNNKKVWLKSNPLKQKEYTSHYKKNNPDKVKNSDRTQNIKHRVRKTKTARLWRHKNPHKIRESNKRHYEKQREWARNHPEIFVFNARVRRGLRRQAQPVWIDNNHRLKIREFYFSAKTKSVFHETSFHVDHIEPLKGINENGEHISCGLHVWWNLQVLPASENIKKSNKLNQPK